MAGLFSFLTASSRGGNNQGMEENEAAAEAKVAGYGGIIGTAGAIAVLLVLYVLSCGPAAVLTERSRLIKIDTWRIIYAPVVWMHDNTPLKEPLEKYVKWWGANP